MQESDETEFLLGEEREREKRKGIQKTESRSKVYQRQSVEKKFKYVRDRVSGKKKKRSMTECQRSLEVF